MSLCREYYIRTRSHRSQETLLLKSSLSGILFFLQCLFTEVANRGDRLNQPMRRCRISLNHGEVIVSGCLSSLISHHSISYQEQFMSKGEMIFPVMLASSHFSKKGREKEKVTHK